MIKVRCSRCQSLKDRGARCPNCSRLYNKERRNKDSEKLYNSYKWGKLRMQVVRYYLNIDIWLLGLTGKLYPCDRTIVHHIKEVTKYPQLALEFSNLVTVGTASHNTIHDYYDNGRYNDAVEIINRGISLFEELKNGGSSNESPKDT